MWLLPVAAETWDGYLNDINGHHVNEDTVVEALEAASTSQPDEGSVGGGTGMNCYQYKGGNGTASRLVEYNGTTYTVGVFLQANFDGGCIPSFLGTRVELAVGHRRCQQEVSDRGLRDRRVGRRAQLVRRVHRRADGAAGPLDGRRRKCGRTATRSAPTGRDWTRALLAALPAVVSTAVAS